MNSYRLVKTCSACPEQYDVFLGDRLVGYLRLRHGFFRAEALGEIVYTSATQGDGSFAESERKTYLDKAIIEIDRFLAKTEVLVPPYTIEEGFDS